MWCLPMTVKKIDGKSFPRLALFISDTSFIELRWIFSSFQIVAALPEHIWCVTRFGTIYKV